jgi:predicted DNA-binding transcriptional regulator AlpA
MTQPLDTLISQPRLRELLGGVSDMTIWRWRSAGTIPEAISINGRNYYRTSEIRAVQEKLFQNRRSA